MSAQRIDRDKILSSVTLSSLIGLDQQIIRDGREYRTLCPWHRDTTPSLTINDDKGFYHCFACGVHGTAIDWLMFQTGCDFRKACDELASLSSVNVLPSPSAPRMRKQGTPYRAVVPVPLEAPAPNFEIGPADNKPALGAPTMTWTYRDKDGNLLGYVCRYRNDPIDGRKEVRTWTYGSYPKSDREWERTVRWRRARWESGTYPLYGLWKLKNAREDQRIWLVSGEKCADALQSIVPDDIVLTWVGGDDGVKHVNWEPLCGLPNIVVFWPDADESGRKAIDTIIGDISELMPGDLFLLNVDDPDLPKGWDVADAVDEGKDAEWLGEFMRKALTDGQVRVREIRRVPRPAALLMPQELQAIEPPTKDIFRDAEITGMEWWSQSWAGRLITPIEGGKKIETSYVRCDFNAAVPLRDSEELKGLLRFNIITRKIDITRPLPWGDGVGEWQDQNMTGLLQWLNMMRFHIAEEMMVRAVERVAYENRYNPLADYLNSLEWDGVPRLETWLPQYTGAEDTLYTRQIGKRWLIGACARAIRPGSQVDTMLVLEGIEGNYKTSLLRTLGGSYFSSQRGDIGASDGRASQQAATMWIIEFAELEALNKSSWTALKDFITTTEETMRLAYRRNPERLFRSAVFAGSTNEREWLPPDGDHRRFWPVKVTGCDVAALTRDRDQLFAEAYHCYKNGERWWVDRSEVELIAKVKDQRDERRFHDEWFSQIMGWLSKPLQFEDAYSLADIARGALNVERDKLDKNTQMRIAKIMRAGGWERVKVRQENGTVWVWRRPESAADLFD